MADIKDLATALNAFQAELVTVGKGKANPFFKSKYAPLDEIMKAAQPVLTKHGLSVVQLPTHIDGQPALSTVVLHTSGQSVEATSPLLLAKNDPQGQGSAITYMRRYAYAAALGIVIDEDDDGNRASQPAQASSAPSSSQPATGPSALATDKQKQLIVEKLAQIGISLEEMKGYLIEQYGVEYPLTKEGAGFVLDDLLNSK